MHQGLDAGWQVAYAAVTADGLARQHIQDLTTRAATAGARIVEVPDRLLSQITGKENAGAIVAAFKQTQRDLASLPMSDSELWVALYEIRDPGNLGTILRTADCASVSGVILIGRCCDPYSVEAVRASMGAVFDMPFVTAAFEEFDTWRRSRSATMIAASVNGRARHDQVNYGAKTVVLMGNEQAGLPGEIEEACDELALIPMRPGADSLNLAQATALMTYEAWRARGYEGATVAL